MVYATAKKTSSSPALAEKPKLREDEDFTSNLPKPVSKKGVWQSKGRNSEPAVMAAIVHLLSHECKNTF